MKKIIRAVMLAMALSVYAQAGIMQYDKTQPPPPPPPATMDVTQDETETQALAEGIMQYDLTAAASQAALATLQSLLTLF